MWKGTKKPGMHPDWRDVFYEHFGGILAAIVVLALGLTALLRADPKDIPAIIGTIFGTPLFCLLGWVLAVCALVVGAVVVWLLRNTYRKELDRVCKERDALQTRLLPPEATHTEDEYNE